MREADRAEGDDIKALAEAIFQGIIVNSIEDDGPYLYGRNTDDPDLKIGIDGEMHCRVLASHVATVLAAKGYKIIKALEIKP